jgi:hypothetical protein
VFSSLRFDSEYQGAGPARNKGPGQAKRMEWKGLAARFLKLLTSFVARNSRACGVPPLASEELSALFWLISLLMRWHAETFYVEP